MSMVGKFSKAERFVGFGDDETFSEEIPFGASSPSFKEVAKTVILIVFGEKVRVGEFQHPFCRGHHCNRGIPEGRKVSCTMIWRTIIDCLSFRQEENIVEEEKSTG
jgi:hypothetical protein